MAILKKFSRRGVERRVKNLIRGLRESGSLDFEVVVDEIKQLDAGEIEQLANGAARVLDALRERAREVGCGL